MNIHKYTIKQESKGFTYLFHLLDESDSLLLTLSIKGGKVKPIEFNGSTYEFKRQSIFSNRRYDSNFKDITIYKENIEYGKVSRKSSWGKNTFGLALNEDIDPLAVALVLASRLITLKSLGYA